MSDYVPLWCKSNFSFLEGASHPEELVEACAHLGLDAMALTDRDGIYGVVEAHVVARELGVHLILGRRSPSTTARRWSCWPPGARGMRTCAG